MVPFKEIQGKLLVFHHEKTQEKTDLLVDLVQTVMLMGTGITNFVSFINGNIALKTCYNYGHIYNYVYIVI